MPKLRRRGKERKLAARLNDLSISQMLDFGVGYSEPTSDFARSRAEWRDLEHFRETYIAVREEYLASHERVAYLDKLPPWAERDYQAQLTGIPMDEDGEDDGDELTEGQ